MQPDILYEDERIVVCVKPQGILSAADASGKPSMAQLLAPRSIWPVHRLDREAGGLMVFAGTPQSAADLSAAIQSGKFEKEYLALCEGFPPEAGEWDDLLYHDRQKNKTYVVARRRAGVKQARLAFCRLGELPENSGAVRVRLYTGRTHQIRVQFASRGFPLCGDRKYGAKTGGKLMLYSWRLSFPCAGKRLSFTLPDCFLPPALRDFACKTDRLEL